MAPCLDADITSDGAGAAVGDRRVGRDSPALAQLRVGTRTATVLDSDLVSATVVPGVDRNPQLV